MQAVCSSRPSTGSRLRQHGRHGIEPRGAHKAKTRIVGAAFGVVPMGHHHQVQAEASQQIQAVDPVRILADLVDFVYRQGETAHGQGGGTGGHQASTGGYAVGEQVGHGRLLPLPQGIGRAARSDQDKVGLAQLAVCLKLVIVAGGRVRLE